MMLQKRVGRISYMVVTNFERSLSELKGASVNVSKSGYYPEPGTASVELLFSDGSRLRADYWRVVKSGNVGLSSFDHDQQYGLPTKIDAYYQLEQELKGRCVTNALLEAETGDLLFRFDGDLEYRAFNFTGYEVWEIHFKNGRGEYSPYARKCNPLT
jgi:hypothetical protein